MPKTDNSVRLLQVTDPHLHADGGGRTRGVNAYDSLLEVVDSARREEWPPDAILATGDLAQDRSEGAYLRFKRVFGDLGIPVLCIPGNHDDPDTMRAVLSNTPFQYCGKADYEFWCVVLLDTFAGGVANGHLDSGSLAFLENTLEAQSGKHMLVCLHHHPLPMGSRWLDGVGLDNADAFLDVLSGHDNVRGVLWGHVHQASDRERNGIKFMSTPSTGAQFLPGSDDFQLDSRPPGYRWLELRADGRIATRVVWLDGYAG